MSEPDESERKRCTEHDHQSGDDEKRCPLCTKPLRYERRGSDYFAWCGGTGNSWGMGCKGIGEFGESAQAARSTIWRKAMDF